MGMSAFTQGHSHLLKEKRLLNPSMTSIRADDPILAGTLVGDVDRLGTSPLKGPLKKAIEKTVRNLANK